MNKKIVSRGLIILVIGAALFIVGSYESGLNVQKYTHTEVSLYKKGEYITENMTLKSGYEILIEGGPSNAGLINSKNLSQVNSTNLVKYEYGSKYYEAVGSDKVFGNMPAGTYTYVMFNSTKPSLKYEYAPVSAIEGYGVMVIIGLITGLAGFIILIVGVIKKPKRPQKDIYDIDNLEDLNNIK